MSKERLQQSSPVVTGLEIGWDKANRECELFTSVAVLDELAQGPEDKRELWPTLLEGIPLLPINEKIIETVEAYIRQLVMPSDSTGDALHLALASYHQCDFLVTWNCKHLANANKFDHIRKVNNQLSLWVPILTTPLELLEQFDESTNY